MNKLLKLANQFCIFIASLQQLKIDKYGNKYWINNEGKLHRENAPAVIYANGAMFYYKNGKLDTDIK